MFKKENTEAPTGIFAGLKVGLLVVDLQRGFDPSEDLVNLIKGISSKYSAVAFTKFENAKESLFRRQLGWHGDGGELCIIRQKQIIFKKYGYGLSKQHIEAIKAMGCDEWHLCGIETDACVLACAFSLFDAGIPVKVLKEACEPRMNASIQALFEKQFGKLASSTEL